MTDATLRELEAIVGPEQARRIEVWAAHDHRIPVLGTSLTIANPDFLTAYAAYAKRHGGRSAQRAEDLARRGGLAWSEIVGLLCADDPNGAMDRAFTALLQGQDDETYRAPLRHPAWLGFVEAHDLAGPGAGVVEAAYLRGVAVGRGKGERAPRGRNWAD